VTVSVVFSLLRPEDAVRVTGVLLHCGVVVTGTCKYLVPAGTVTVGGTEAAPGLLLERLTGQPPAGASAPRLMTRVAFVPPATEEGVTPSDASAGSNVREECAVAPNRVAVMVPVVAEVTYEELIVNVAWFVPRGTMTVAGTVIEGVFALRATVAPPELALKFRKTSPEAVAPPIMLPGFTNSPPSKGETVTVFCPTPEAVILTAVSEVTSGVDAVVTVKVAVVEPPGTVTLAGTVTSDVILLLRLTRVPPVGAGFARVTVPVGLSPFET